MQSLLKSGSSLSDKAILKASVLVAISAILYGFLGFIGTSVVQENISITTMLFWRFFIAGSWMFLFAIKKHSSGQINPIDKRILIFVFFLGAVGYAGSSECYFIASQYTGTGLAMVILFAYPIVIAVISWMKNRKNFTFSTLFALVAMMIGLILLNDSSLHSFNLAGIFFGLVAAFCYAFYVIGSKRISFAMIDSNVLTTAVCWGCALVFFVLAISSHSFRAPQTMKDWLYFFSLGVFVTAIPIQLMLEGLKYISSMRASIISVLEPLVTVLVGILLLHESISHLQVFGTVIILTCALWVQFQKKL